MKFADLHLHTVASDGALTPAGLLEAASRRGLAAVGITDHDSVDSLPAAIGLFDRYGVEVVPGVELSVEGDGVEIHLLGYYLDFQDPDFQSELCRLKNAREVRARAMLEKLEGLGFPLDLSEHLPGQMKGTVGRLHIALALQRAGYVGTVQEAFARYIGKKGPAYVPKPKLGPEKALGMILRLGGVPVLAHPGNLGRDHLIPKLVEWGLQGIEVYYPSHSPEETERYAALAKRLKLLITGGSDCHGLNKGELLMGRATVPYEAVEKLKEKSVENRENRLKAEG